MNTQRKDLSTKKGTIFNPGLIWNKTGIPLLTYYGNLNDEIEKKKKNERRK